MRDCYYTLRPYFYTARDYETAKYLLQSPALRRLSQEFTAEYGKLDQQIKQQQSSTIFSSAYHYFFPRSVSATLSSKVREMHTELNSPTSYSISQDFKRTKEGGFNTRIKEGDNFFIKYKCFILAAGWFLFRLKKLALITAAIGVAFELYNYFKDPIQQMHDLSLKTTTAIGVISRDKTLNTTQKLGKYADIYNSKFRWAVKVAENLKEPAHSRN